MYAALAAPLKDNGEFESWRMVRPGVADAVGDPDGVDAAVVELVAELVGVFVCVGDALDDAPGDREGVTEAVMLGVALGEALALGQRMREIVAPEDARIHGVVPVPRPMAESMALATLRGAPAMLLTAVAVAPASETRRSAKFAPSVIKSELLLDVASRATPMGAENEAAEPTPSPPPDPPGPPPPPPASVLTAPVSITMTRTRDAGAPSAKQRTARSSPAIRTFASARYPGLANVAVAAGPSSLPASPRPASVRTAPVALVMTRMRRFTPSLTKSCSPSADAAMPTGCENCAAKRGPSAEPLEPEPESVSTARDASATGSARMRWQSLSAT
jgi:hypothetical protein